MDMGEKENIAPRQEYVGWADVESVEYKYPPRTDARSLANIKKTTLEGKPSGVVFLMIFA